MSDELQLRALTTASNEPEAALVLGRLEEAGIRYIARPRMGAMRAAWATRRIYVNATDLERARAVLADATGGFDEEELSRLSQQAVRATAGRDDRPGD